MSSSRSFKPRAAPRNLVDVADDEPQIPVDPELLAFRERLAMRSTPLEFREVIDGVTKVPDACILPSGEVNVPVFLRWFCPTLTVAEAQRLADLPHARGIPITKDPLTAFIRAEAFR